MRYLLSAILFLFFVLPSFAQDVTLSWDISPSTGVTGYKLHYQADPYVVDQWDGTGATQGNSPIDVGNVLTYQVTNLTDGVIYYFVVTAYDDDGYCSISTWANQVDCEANGATWSIALLESTYSNIVNTAQGDTLHIGTHGMRFWQVSDGEANRGTVRF